MGFNKQDIYKALEKITAPGEGKNMVESNAVKNVVVFGKEVIVDVVINNPTLQAKKKTEVEIMKIIHEEVDQKIDVKVNIKAEVPEKPVDTISGKKIPGAGDGDLRYVRSPSDGRRRGDGCAERHCRSNRRARIDAALIQIGRDTT